MQEIGKKREIGKSRKSENVGNQNKQEIRKQENLKKQEIKKVGCWHKKEI